MSHREAVVPAVSVVIPNHNRESLIGETLDNLFRQTLPPCEVIVVDDGSTDGSVEVIKSFGNRVTLIEQQNQGPGSARNAGLAVAAGDYIQFQDSDDLFSLNKLEVQTCLLEQTEADIAFSPWVKVTLQGGRAKLGDHVLQQRMPSSRLTLACWWLRGWSTVFQSFLFRRSFIERIGPYRTDMMIGEDGELFFRMLLAQPQVAFSGDCLTVYRQNAANKLTQDGGLSQSGRIVDWAKCLCHICRLCDAASQGLDPVTRLAFLAGVRKHLRYLASVPARPEEVYAFLRARVAAVPAPILASFELWERLGGGLRRRLRGARWMPAYQSSPPTKAQLGLIRELGYEV